MCALEMIGSTSAQALFGVKPGVLVDFFLNLKLYGRVVHVADTSDCFMVPFCERTSAVLKCLFLDQGID